MKAAVIIPSLYHKDGEYLKGCVESLRKTVDWDIIVVTNGSEYKPDLSHIHGITVHLHTARQGQCGAVNMGANIAPKSVDYLMVSNSDMYYAPGWNKNISSHQLDYVWSPNLIEPTNNPGSAAPFLKLDAGFTLEEFKQRHVDDMVRDFVNEPAIHYGHENGHFLAEEPGFNLPFFIHQGVWRTIGGYDTAYDPWGSNSDTDLQTKINLAGITPKRYRDVLVYHFSNKSGTFDGSHQELWQRNWDYFDKKWGFNRDQLGSDVWYNKAMLPEDREKILYKPDWAFKYV
jgi:GT2 family glycosyltransferase